MFEREGDLLLEVFASAAARAGRVFESTAISTAISAAISAAATTAAISVQIGQIG